MNIKSYRIDNEYFVTKLDNFNEFKKQFVDIIKHIPYDKIENDYETVRYTDWDKMYEDKIYADLLKEYVDPFFKQMAHHLECKYFSVYDFWFQVYEEGDFHDWHNHVSCMYSNVLYLHLEDENFSTELYDRYNNKIIRVPEAVEGTILTFPSNYAHRSKPLSKGKKIILSFNTSFFDMYREDINNRLNE